MEESKTNKLPNWARSQQEYDQVIAECEAFISGFEKELTDTNYKTIQCLMDSDPDDTPHGCVPKIQTVHFTFKNFSHKEYVCFVKKGLQVSETEKMNLRRGTDYMVERLFPIQFSLYVVMNRNILKRIKSGEHTMPFFGHDITFVCKVAQDPTQNLFREFLFYPIGLACLKDELLRFEIESFRIAKLYNEQILKNQNKI